MAGKQNYRRFTTPRGVFIYPHMTEPDMKYPKNGIGNYHTKLALDSEDAAPLVDELQKILDEFVAAGCTVKGDPIKPATLKKATVADIVEEEFDEEGNETGRVIFKFKLDEKVVLKTGKSWDQKPRLFDAAAQQITDPINVWTGSEGKVNLEVHPYFMESSKTFGLSLRLIGAQILKLVSGGGASAEDMGFGAEEGFTATSGAADTGFSPEGDDAGDEEEF